MPRRPPTAGAPPDLAAAPPDAPAPGDSAVGRAEAETPADLERAAEIAEIVGPQDPARLRRDALHFAAILATALDAIVAMDTEGRIIEWNAAAERTFGHRRADVVGRELAEVLIPAPLRERHRQGFRRYLATGVPTMMNRRLELRALRADGSELPVELAITAFEAGGTRFFTGYLRDISDRLRTEAERAHLLVEEQRARADAEAAMRRLADLEAITEAALASITLDDLLDDLLPRTRATFAADSVALLLLSEDGEYLALRAADGLEEDEVGTNTPGDSGITGAILAGRRPLTVDDLSAPGVPSSRLAELGLRSLVGAPLRIEGRAIGLLRVAACEPARYAPGDATLLQLVADRVATGVDRARLFEAEHRARAQAEAVERQVAFLYRATSALLADPLSARARLDKVAQVLVPSLGTWCAVDLADEDGRVIERFSTAHQDPARADEVARLLGRYPARADDTVGPSFAIRVGRTSVIAEATPSAIDALALDPALAPAVHALGASAAVVVPMIARGRTLGAITIVADWARAYVRDDVALVEEVSYRAALALDNARLYRDAQRAAQAREELLAVVSHDLKNPLSAVLMNARMLLRERKRTPAPSPAATPTEPARANEEPTHRRAAGIERAALRMQHLIGDLLDSASIEAGRLRVERRDVDVAQLVADAIEMMAPIAAERSIAVARELPSAPVAVSCDRERILQVFSNLLGNALKFTPPGGRVTVRAEPAPGGAEMRFSIADTGSGIEPSVLERIFDRFFQGRTEAARHGTGLGLYIARGIVDAHGGRMTVESVVGAGSTFSFTLPVASAPASDAPPDPDPDAAPTPPA